MIRPLVKLLCGLMLTMICLFPNITFAATTNPMLSESTVDLTAFLKMLLGLVGILALIFILAWLSRKMKFVQNMSSGYQIKNLATLSLSRGEKVSLIEVGGKQLLIGVAPGSVNSIYVFDEELSRSENTSGDEKPAFASHFKKALGFSQQDGEKA